MYYVFLMHEVESSEELWSYIDSYFLARIDFFIIYLVLQSPSIDKFSYNVKSVLILKKLQYSRNILMVAFK